MDRAVTWGWARDRIVVIDEDQGQSGQSMVTRLGFQRLLAEVSLDHVGLILGLEMRRLARSNKDWHQLLELCAIFRTLLADADGLYDPTDYNDRLLLGLRGMMNEAALYIMQGRLLEGRRHKAQRGDLLNEPPLGYVRGPDGDYQLDPDEQAQRVVRLICDVFSKAVCTACYGIWPPTTFGSPCVPTPAPPAGTWSGIVPVGRRGKTCCTIRSMLAPIAGDIV